MSRDFDWKVWASLIYRDFLLFPPRLKKKRNFFLHLEKYGTSLANEMRVQPSIEKFFLCVP